MFCRSSLLSEKKTAVRADHIQASALQLNLPICALSGSNLKPVTDSVQSTPVLLHQPYQTDVEQLL
ncbi:hypothetical protein JMY91_17065 [Brenneria goodwinii]|nr:hypothetical protein [Brenneria goodwinii]